MVCQCPSRGGATSLRDLVPKDRRPRERRGNRGLAQADLEPLPRRVRANSWVEMRARVLVRASGAKVMPWGPAARRAPSPPRWSRGRYGHAFPNLYRPGTWTLELVLDGDRGPRPVLEALVFAGVAPPMPPRLLWLPVRKPPGG